MDEQAAFIRAICEQPADDTVRLVFADWLEENGQEQRAWYIRGQLRGGVSSVFVGGHDSLGWFPRTHEVGERATFTVTRGFLSRVELPCADFMEYAKELFAAHPITSVRLTDVRPNETDREPGFRDYFCWPSRQSSRVFFLAQAGHLKTGHDSWRDTAEECMADLSAACVAYGRELAGLPVLAAVAGG